MGRVICRAGAVIVILAVTWVVVVVVMVGSMPVALHLAVFEIQAVSLFRSVMALAALVTRAAMTISMPVAACSGIGAGLRKEGGQAVLQLQPPLLQQIGQHRILKQPQLIGAHLQRHMAVAEVISRPQQVEGGAGAHHQQGLSGRLHPHWRIAGRTAEPFARLQRLAALQLQHQITTAGTTAMSAQPGALIGAEGEAQPRLWGAGRRRAGALGEGEGPGCGFRQGGWLPEA